MVMTKEDAEKKACPFALNQRLIFQHPSPVQGAGASIDTRTFNCITEACMSWAKCKGETHGYCVMLHEEPVEMFSEADVQ